MPISWKTSDGNTGIAENDYEFAMQHKGKGDREELAPQDRINQAFGEGPAAPEIKDQNAPYSWGMGDDLKGLGGQPDAPADEWQKAYGDKRAGEFIPIKIERAERSGLNSRYPTETDRSISQGNDLSYGDPSAGYFDNFRLNAKVRSIGKYDLADRVNANEPLNDKLEPITYDKSNELHRAWLAARKSGLATIGFDPHVSIGSPDDGTQLTLGGLYRRKDDTIWYDSSMPDALVHESMHRGYAKLKEEGIVPKNSIYDEETIVRALIQKHLGDVELSGKDKPTAGDKQVLAGKDMLERHGDYLDRLEFDAAKYYATKRGKKSTELEPTMHEQLASFQQRLDTTPPEEAGAFRKFLGSLNIMPAPGKPESEWTAKEHFGVLLNTAMAGMGGGIRGPGIVSPGNFKTALSKAGPAANMNRESYQINPTPYEEAQLEASWKALGKDLSKPDLKAIEGGKGLTTETEPQLQQAQHGGSIEQVSNPAIRIEGEVYHAPGTHGDAYMKAIEAYGQGAKIPKGEEGFITTHGRFVDRVEAGEIALKAKQIGLRIGRLDTDNFDPALPPSKTLEWPEGWGTKLPEGKRILSASDYPHIQKAFKEAVEQGKSTSSEVSDYILEKHGIDLSSYMVKRLQETSGVKLEDKIVNATNSGWTPELIGKLKEGFDKGKSFQTLADELGQSRGQIAGKVSRLLKEGVLVDRPTMTSGVEANPEKMARFKELRSKGLSYKEIAQDLNITTSYARVIASRNKL